MNDIAPPPAPQHRGKALLDGYVDKSTIAGEFGVCERTVDRWCDQPDGLPYVRVGRKRLFRVDAFRSWLAGRETRRNQRRRTS